MTETIDGALKKAFWICKHLLAGGCITKEKLMDELEISDMSAKRWMSAASRQLPITVLGHLYGHVFYHRMMPSNKQGDCLCKSPEIAWNHDHSKWVCISCLAANFDNLMD